MSGIGYAPTELNPSSSRSSKLIYARNLGLIPDFLQPESLKRTAIEKVYRWIFEGLKKHFGIEYSVNSADRAVNINKWLTENYPRLAKKQIPSFDMKIPVLRNSFSIVKYDAHTFIIILTGDKYTDLLLNDKRKLIMMNMDTLNDWSIYMYIFGKHAPRVQKILREIEDKKETGENELALYSMYGEERDMAFRSIFQRVPARKLNTIFMEDGIIEGICEHIDRYLDTRGTYTGRGIIYKTGILLYGEPGTGKSSLIKALACKYERDLIVADMTTFRYIGIESLTQSLNADDSKYIMALEDIDCIIMNRENENADKDDREVINKLLQFLDSNNSPNDIIFIATTNHIELLDDALLREGRFDKIVEITGIYEDKAREMAASFDLDEKTVDTVIEEVKSDGFDLIKTPIRQSKLQNMILKHTGLNIKSEIVDEDEISEEEDSNDVDDDIVLEDEYDPSKIDYSGETMPMKRED